MNTLTKTITYEIEIHKSNVGHTDECKWWILSCNVKKSVICYINKKVFLSVFETWPLGLPHVWRKKERLDVHHQLQIINFSGSSDQNVLCNSVAINIKNLQLQLYYTVHICHLKQMKYGDLVRAFTKKWWLEWMARINFTQLGETKKM